MMSMIVMIMVIYSDRASNNGGYESGGSIRLLGTCHLLQKVSNSLDLSAQ